MIINNNKNDNNNNDDKWETIYRLMQVKRNTADENKYHCKNNK